MNEIIKQDTGEVISAAKVTEYLTAFGLLNKLTPEEKTQCVEIAKEFQLNPFKREIHFVKYGSQAVSIVIGYDVFIKRAERAGKLDGWKAWVEGNGPDMVAKIEIYRKDWGRPFQHEVYLQEAKGAGPMWTKAPRMMLKKVAIGQGFRLCFPDELGGLPYLPEEIDAQDAPAIKKAEDVAPSADLDAAGKKVKAWAAEHQKQFPDDIAVRNKVKREFMAFVTAKQDAEAIAYAEALPPFTAPDTSTIDAEASEAFGDVEQSAPDPVPDAELF